MNLYLRALPKKHSCGEVMEKKNIVLAFSKDYPVNYCTKCELYEYFHGESGLEGISSKDPDMVAEYIEKLQRGTLKEFKNKS